MRPALLILVFVVSGFTAGAQQFTVLPQVGVENSRTTLRYNDLPSFSPAGSQLSPRLGLRMDYQFNKTHGPFLGVATSRSVVAYEFSDPENGMSRYKASPDNQRLHLEAGYQVSTKPIYFKKAKPVQASPASSVRTITVRKGCGSYYTYKVQCEKPSGRTATAKAADKGWYMRIMPSVGAAFVRGVSPEVSTQTLNSQTNYKYMAGNWKTAVIGGAGFEFGSNVERKFTVSINYLQGVSNLGSRSITTASEGKTMITNVKSGVSGWNISAGIPITISKKKPVVIERKQENYSKPERKCGQYRSRCGKAI